MIQETREKDEDKKFHFLDEDSMSSWVEFWSKESDDEVRQKMENWMSVLQGLKEMEWGENKEERKENKSKSNGGKKSKGKGGTKSKGRTQDRKCVSARKNKPGCKGRLHEARTRNDENKGEEQATGESEEKGEAAEDEQQQHSQEKGEKGEIRKMRWADCDDDGRR